MEEEKDGKEAMRDLKQEVGKESVRAVILRDEEQEDEEEEEEEEEEMMHAVEEGRTTMRRTTTTSGARVSSAVWRAGSDRSSEAWL